MKEILPTFDSTSVRDSNNVFGQKDCYPLKLKTIYVNVLWKSQISLRRGTISCKKQNWSHEESDNYTTEEECILTHF